MKRALLVVLLFATPAYAQAPKKSPDAYSVTLTPQDIQVLGIALGQRPWQEVTGLINRINAQIEAQNRAWAERTEKPQAEEPKQ